MNSVPSAMYEKILNGTVFKPMNKLFVNIFSPLSDVCRWIWCVGCWVVYFHTYGFYCLLTYSVSKKKRFCLLPLTLYFCWNNIFQIMTHFFFPLFLDLRWSKARLLLYTAKKYLKLLVYRREIKMSLLEEPCPLCIWTFLCSWIDDDYENFFE